MALNGVLNTTAYDGRYLQFTWGAKQDISKNQSTITWSLKGAGKGGSNWYYAAPFYLSIGGEEITIPTDRIQLYEGTLIKSGTKVITHNDSGKASFNVVIKGAIYQQSYNVSGSGNFTLDNIPRKATITSAPNFYDTSSPTIKYSNPAGSSVTSLQMGIFKTDNSTPIAGYRDISKAANSYTFTFTDAERQALQKVNINANSTTVRVFIKTEISGKTYTHYRDVTLTIYNGAPTLAPIVKDTNAKTLALTGDADKLIKYYSTVTFNNNEKAQKFATIKSRSVVSGSKSATTASGDISGVDSAKFDFTVTDSRGNTTKKTITKTLIEYVRLTCSMEASAELADNNTTTIKYDISGKYFNGSFGAVANSLSLWIRVRKKGEEWGTNWQTVEAKINGNAYSASGSVTDLDYLEEYEIQAISRDKIWEAYSNFSNSQIIAISTKPVFDWSKDDFNFNVPVTIQGKKIKGSKVLWSGANYMTDAQTIQLNEKISEQSNGIVLVFSRFSPTSNPPAALNHNFSYHFIPGIIVSSTGGYGSTFMLAHSCFNTVATKYLYITDTTIKGHADNTASGSQSGITYNNSNFVLRYVVGV